MNKSIALLVTATFLSCTKDKGELIPNYQCQSIPIQNNYSRIELIQSFDSEILQGVASVDVPTSNGAMGRNKSGYFHVRFQMGISAQADYAVYNQNAQALDYAIQAIEYAFEYQLPDGNFTLVVPEELSNQIPTEADVASGVSFFLTSLGLALSDFEQSTWYNSTAMADYKNRIEILRPTIEKAAQWLTTKKELLEQADQNAPNRLLFNALAFYSLGEWLNDSALKTIGISFAATAISKQHPNGYFLEGNGWDSSYQGVGINVGFNLYSLLPDTEPLKATLWSCLSCATDWQQSRILNDGEISTEGNTRVYPGGESFLGNEKSIDWIDTMLGFFMMGYFTNESSFIVKANDVKNYYY